MIKSMTAYGRGEVETPVQKWVVELKSVNHRFLELALNLPRRFWALEDRFRKLIKSRLARGRVDMQLSWENLEEKPMTLRLDKAVVAGVRDVLEQLRLAGSTPESLKLEHFLHFSDLLVAKEQANQDLDVGGDLGDGLPGGEPGPGPPGGDAPRRGRGPGRRPVRAPLGHPPGSQPHCRAGAALAPNSGGRRSRLAWRSSFPRAARWMKPAWPRKWP